MTEIAVEDIESDGRTGMTEMGITIDSGTAYIHPYMTLMQGLEGLLGAFQRVVEKKLVIHIFMVNN